MKLVQRGRCSAEVLCPAESLPVTHPSHHPSMVMSTPPAKTVNTELLVTHDFAIASILKKCFLKTSHSRLSTNEIVQRNTEPPLGQYAEKKEGKREEEKTHICGFTWPRSSILPSGCAGPFQQLFPTPGTSREEWKA